LKKVIVLAALVLVLGFSVRGASANSQPFQQTFEGHTGNVDFFSFNAICDECFDDDFDVDSGSSGLGSQIGIDGNFNWVATNQNLLNYTPALGRQGSNLDTSVTTFPVPGAATVNYHFYGAWGLFNDPDGVGDPTETWNPTIWTGSVDTWLTSTIDCALPLQGGVTVCQKDEFFGIAVINTPFAQFQMRLKLTTVVTVDSTGVVGVRTAAVNAGEPIPDAPLIYTGSDPGTFTDPMFISCTQPAGEHLSYSLNNVHLDASSVNLHHSARLNFAVLDPFGIDTWSSVDTPGLQVIDATFGSGVNLTTEDITFDLGKIAPDLTHPTIEPLPFFIGWEGAPIQLHADASDNCGAPLLRWDFSDGGVAFGPNPEHTFADDGLYTGQLTATDVTGLTTTITFQVTVLNRTPEVSAGPDKSYDWGIPVPFHANGLDQGPIDNQSLLYTWNFDDPTDPLGAAGQDVNHVYSQPGTRNAVVTAADKDGASSTDAVQVTVTKRDSTTAYTGATFGRKTDSVLLRSSLVGEYGEPLAGRVISFNVDGQLVGSAMTDGTGAATLSWAIPLGTALGDHPVLATFSGDALYNTSNSSALFTVISVAKEVTFLSYTGPVASKPAKPLPLSAILLDDEGNAVEGKTVTFTLESQSCSATTDAFGAASCTIAKLAAKSGTYALAVNFAGDGNYLASQAVQTFIVGK
jgi:PKD repeat protein